MSQVNKIASRQLKLKKSVLHRTGMEINSSNIDSLRGASSSCTATANTEETGLSVGEIAELSSRTTTGNDLIKSKNENPKKQTTSSQTTQANEAKLAR